MVCFVAYLHCKRTDEQALEGCVHSVCESSESSGDSRDRNVIKQVVSTDS